MRTTYYNNPYWLLVSSFDTRFGRIRTPFNLYKAKVKNLLVYAQITLTKSLLKTENGLTSIPTSFLDEHIVITFIRAWK